MNGLNFKPSPFYIISETLTPIQTCPSESASLPCLNNSADLLEVVPNHRHVVSTTFQLTANQLHTINSLKQKVMVYCTQLDPTLGTAARVDIAFPQQVELRVNNVQVQANLRGLKNKPGSTRPADITNQLIKTASYKNAVQLTYAHTHKVNPGTNSYRILPTN